MAGYISDQTCDPITVKISFQGRTPHSKSVCLALYCSLPTPDPVRLLKIKQTVHWRIKRGSAEAYSQFKEHSWVLIL